MLLKCIGGICHGQIRKVDSHYRLGDQIRIPLKVKFNLLSFEKDLKAWHEDNSLSDPYAYYKIEEIHFSNNSNTNKIKFLIPVHWKFEDAMIMLLTCV